MSWSSPMRVLGVCGVWLAIQTGCGGNPSVSNTDPGTNAGSSTGGTDNTGTGGTLIISTGGQDDNAGGSDDKPTEYVCGNGELEPGEFCDDGNTADDDGCSGDCSTTDPDYDCSAVGEKCVQVVICGNGVIEGDEACDDMNQTDGDGCAADCGVVEDGWACVRPGQPCVGVSVCGNGVRERGEACDDGQLPPLANDGCDDKCQIETGYYCPNPGMKCVQQVCGDGVRTPGEACDDGQTPPADNDGCSHLCVVEAGWHCNSAGCKPECGDGLLRGTEGCDDNNAIGGDGCSSACAVEPFYKCTQASPSVCTTSITCGNNMVEPGEVCDPPGQNGCKAGCKSFDPDTTSTAVCGNNVIEDNETCDPPAVGNGCAANCKVEANWTCPQAGVCFKNPACGDNLVQAGEGCDPPNVGNGCSAACQPESGYTCVGLGPSTCTKPVCNNSIVDPGEQCDDGGKNAGDGCGATCMIENGWSCPTPGAACIPKCGDGLKLGTEQCDDGPANRASGDGCNAGCKIEFGFKCPTAGQKCVATVCGDGAKMPLPNGTPDPGEGCDLGDTIAGDGCSATCQVEPTVTVGPNPVVNVKCGDGLLTTGTGEVCDDGNTVSGDGCEADCKSKTPGWDCVPKVKLPPTLEMRITYRDFKSAAAANGHPDFMYDDLSHVAGITGGVCTTATAASADKTKCGHLDVAGKPELIINNQGSTGIRDADTFKMWYRDGNPDNVKGYDTKVISSATITSTLLLKQINGTASEVYQFDSMGNNFYPINGQGLGNIGTEGIGCGRDFPAGNGQPADEFDGVKNYHDSVANPGNPPACFCTDKTNDGVGACLNKNYGFTSEIRYFFQYKGGETLTFSGDDDVWVYVNGRVAVDMGGLHSQKNGQVLLGDDGSGAGGVDSDCSAHSTDTLPDTTMGCYSAGEIADNTDARFGLTKGNVYEIVLFHAERHVDASNFKLTLAGFLAPRSSCDTICPDGTVAGDEVCDGNGADPNQAGACNATCTAFAYCGDSVIQSANPTKGLPAEACDNGTNTDLYQTASSPANVCAPGCKKPAFCGDNVLQAGQGEQCDKGGQNNDTSYGKNSCTTKCKLGGYCGDGTQQAAGGEACDLGVNNGKYGPSSCGYDCQPGPRCGDHIRNGAEQCDDGADNGMATSHCATDCTIKPYCGDGIKQNNEECDYGQFASTEYGGCTTICKFGPRCGDGGPGNTPDVPEEECDYGTAGNTGGYKGCTSKCGLGPRCGDAEVQANQGEACDNGFNADDYDDPKTPAAECGPGCTPPPFCGDKVVQSAHELCDDGAQNNDTTYEGCTTLCEFGPFCGDGDVSGPEACDDGFDNVSYAAVKGGCSYECQPAPYCGDGERNGPEQCDLGSDENTGEYGTCNADCSFAPRCGDGKKNGSEQCDDGPSGSLSCTPLCKKRVVVQ